MRKKQITFNRSKRLNAVFASFLLFAFLISATAQNKREYPKEIRGYKVTTAKIEIKKEKDAQTNNQTPKPQNDPNQNQGEEETDALVKVGEPKLVRVTPFGVTFEITVTVSAVKQGGKVDLLVFEDVTVNNTNVTIEDYLTPFDIPNEKAIQLPHAIRVFVSMPNALTNVFGEVIKPQETWPVKGRVYVCGRYKKLIFKFKRAVPIEFDLNITNPLRLKNEKTTEKVTTEK